MTDMVVGLLSMAGVVVGATLQYWFSRASEHRRHMEVLRAQSYIDYLRGVANAAHAITDDERIAARRSVADAKARMAVYATADVLTALAEFERTGAVLSSDDSCRIFAELATAMRQKQGQVGGETIRLVLTGCPRRAETADCRSTMR